MNELPVLAPEDQENDSTNLLNDAFVFFDTRSNEGISYQKFFCRNN